MTPTVVGRSVPRIDLRDKLTGDAKYTADLKLPGMLVGLVLRSPHPHADILSIDTSQAAQLPGVYAIVTPFDAPPGRVAPDMPVLDTRVRFVGDEVAAVAADDADIAQQALDLIRVEYQVLPFILEPGAALKPGAIAIHPQGNLATEQPLSLERGDVERGFSGGDGYRKNDATPRKDAMPRPSTTLSFNHQAPTRKSGSRRRAALRALARKPSDRS